MQIILPCGLILPVIFTLVHSQGSFDGNNPFQYQGGFQPPFPPFQNPFQGKQSDGTNQPMPPPNLWDKNGWDKAVQQGIKAMKLFLDNMQKSYQAQSHNIPMGGGHNQNNMNPFGGKPLKNPFEGAEHSDLAEHLDDLNSEKKKHKKSKS